MRKQFANEVKLTSMVISLAEQTNKEYKEDVNNFQIICFYLILMS